MSTYLTDLRENKKAINLILRALFYLFISTMVIYVITLDKRVYLKTDIIYKYEKGKAGAGRGARYDEVSFAGKDYFLYRNYLIVPSLLVSIERKILNTHEGDTISYYIDPKQGENWKDRYGKRYIAIGPAIGNISPKNEWYWFSLIGYAFIYSLWFQLPALVIFSLNIVKYYSSLKISDSIFWILNLVLLLCYFFIF